MDRRIFIRKGSLTGLLFCGVSSFITKETKGVLPEINKFISEKLIVDFELNEISITSLQDKMKSGQFSSRSITEMYLKRIEAIDKSGPKINSIIQINPDALLIADAMDNERKSGKVRGPMHGIPVLIKDNIDTGDKMMTTAGSLAMVGNIASKDAYIIQQLRKSGAVLLGKTNLSEWANFRSSRSTSGWSSRGGQTKNPNMLDRNPCGSSSGSGAAVSANLCVVAIGSETDGSIIGPSSFCGIVGIKPTVGLLSQSGIIPISKTQDTAGPMARTVQDAAILLSALARIDSSDSTTDVKRLVTEKDYSIFLDSNALKGKRIGVEKSFLKGHEGVVAVYKQAIESIKKLGAEIIEVELMDKISTAAKSEYTLLKYEFKDGINKYLSKANANVKSLQEVINYNNANESKAMPFFKQEILEQCNLMGDLSDKEYKDALTATTSCRGIIDTMLSIQKLDAICGTSIGPANLIDLVNGDYDTGFYFCQPAAMAGYPHITVPMGTLHKLPLGLSFISGPNKEGLIIGLAYAFEQATHKRIPPKFLSGIQGI